MNPTPDTGQDLASAWSDLLSPIEWHHFITVTYREPVHAAEKVERDWRRFLFEWQLLEAVRKGRATIEDRPGGRRIRGPFATRHRAGRDRPMWVLGIENHKSGSLHAHGLVRWSGSMRCSRFALAARAWHRGNVAGWVEVAECQDTRSASAYVSKYAAKGGDIMLSPNLVTPALATLFQGPQSVY